jgi:predicted aspartyl protease
MNTALLMTMFACLSCPALAQGSSEIGLVTEGSTAAAETLTTGEDSSNRMTVPIMINGQGPFRFIIDTGSSSSVVSREVADRLMLPVGKKARVVSMGGVSESHMVKINTLGVSANRELKSVNLPAFPEKYIGADGLLGLDALKGQRILLDFAAQTMLVEPGNSKAVRDEPVTTNTIVVRGRNRLGQLVLVDADANGQDVWVVVDTGAQTTVGNNALRSLMVKRTPKEGFQKVELLSVVGERIPADYALVGKMRIGGVQIGNAAVAFTEIRPFKTFGLNRRPAMLLGMESLRGFRRVSIDFANKRVRFLLPDGAVVGAAK